MPIRPALLLNVIFFVLFSFVVLQCKEEDPVTLPVMSTLPLNNIKTTSADAGGFITSTGGAEITARGVCWSTEPNPSIDAGTKTSDGIGIGSYSSNLTGLAPGTQYFVRAYSTNKAGTVYGNELTFTTEEEIAASVTLPGLTTEPVVVITVSTAQTGGTVTTDGGAIITARGICWSVNPGPTTDLATKTSDGAGSEPFTSTLTNLVSNTMYYVRAYATNSVGTAYGNEVLFTAPTIPQVTTALITHTAPNQAQTGGNVTKDGGAAITARGICWSITSGPTFDLTTKTSDGTGTGSFTSTITNLIAGTKYYVRAYATNIAGTTYGSELSFTAQSTLTDIDGNVYNMVIIGSQYWMTENLKTARYRDGSPITFNGDPASFVTLTAGAYSIYNNSTANATYGKLYNFYAVTDSRGLCPSGSHVPSMTEWQTLLNFLGSDQARKLKEAGSAHWPSPNNGTNDYNFTALPGGNISPVGFYMSVGSSAAWWTSQENSTTLANSIALVNNGSVSDPFVVLLNKPGGLSVRCLAD